MTDYFALLWVIHSRSTLKHDLIGLKFYYDKVLHQAWPTDQEDIPYQTRRKKPRLTRTRPTDGSDCGSLRDHNLTLLAAIGAGGYISRESQAMPSVRFV